MSAAGQHQVSIFDFPCSSIIHPSEQTLSWRGSLSVADTDRVTCSQSELLRKKHDSATVVPETDRDQTHVWEKVTHYVSLPYARRRVTCQRMGERKEKAGDREPRREDVKETTERGHTHSVLCRTQVCLAVALQVKSCSGLTHSGDFKWMDGGCLRCKKASLSHTTESIPFSLIIPFYPLLLV